MDSSKRNICDAYRMGAEFTIDDFKWSCEKCVTKNHIYRTKCSSCGHGRNPPIKKDWHCRPCKVIVPADEDHCTKCKCKQI